MTASTRSYAGIGSRSTPAADLARMRELAIELAHMGYEMRSGAADGADTAFEQGSDAARGRKAIFLPWPGFQGRYPDPKASTYLPSPEAFELAATIHPAWSRLSRGPQALHSRNCHQCLGRALDAPADFVVCWTADGAESARETTSKTGGTGTAIRLASLRGIPVFNLVRDDAEERLRAFLADRPAVSSPPVADEVDEEPFRIVLRFPS